MIPRHIVLMGPPGGGKSTDGKALAERMGVPLIDVGDMLRAEGDGGSDLGHQVESYMKQGDLAPGKLVALVLDRRLAQPDVANGFIVDGYGRDMEDIRHLMDWSQANKIHDLAFVGLQVPTSEILHRLGGRRLCEHGHTVNIEERRPQVADHCDLDGSRLARRPDDDPKVVSHRLDIYHQQTQPVLDFLTDQGLYQEIDGTGPVATVVQRLTETLKSWPSTHSTLS